MNLKTSSGNVCHKMRTSSSHSELWLLLTLKCKRSCAALPERGFVRLRWSVSSACLWGQCELCCPGMRATSSQNPLHEHGTLHPWLPRSQLLTVHQPVSLMVLAVGRCWSDSINTDGASKVTLRGPIFQECLPGELSFPRPFPLWDG